MERRIEHLELKLAEQERANAALREDIQGLKEIQNGDRKEYQTGYEHFEAKKKKLYALLGRADSSILALQDQQERLATKEELQSLSHRLDDLKTIVDRAAAGMHASASPQTPDLIVFSPDRSLIGFDENVVPPVNSVAGVETRPETQPLQPSIGSSTSPVLDVSNAGAVPSLRNDPEDVPSTRSSVTEREPSPFVRIEPPAATVQTVNEDQNAQMAKRVRFNLSAQGADSPPSDSGSEDILAPNATLRKKLLGKHAKDIAAANEDSPLPTAKSSKPSSRKSAAVTKSSSDKPAGILDQFKNGCLNSDSADEDETPVQMQIQTPVSDSQNTEATIDLAERAIAFLVEAAIDGAAAGTRRSSRVPKQKDFGNVEVHGWKTKRIRRS